MTATTPGQIAALNVGSTSLKLDWFEFTAGTFHHDEQQHWEHPFDEATIAALLAQKLGSSDYLLHRVVHGGNQLQQPCLLSESSLAELDRWSVVAPLHNPPALTMIRACLAAGIQQCRQWLCFDTSLFHDLPAVARHYPLPSSLTLDVPPLRYGFHGLAHANMHRQWQRACPEEIPLARAISLQLGGGCSITARQGDQVIDTSMGFTPLEGLMMTSRSGDIDPGLLLYLIEQCGYSASQVNQLLNQQSGLKGMTGRGMRDLLKSQDATAEFAIELFCYRARKALGAMIAALGGVDVILFGGGIGENAASVRTRIIEPLQSLGLGLDTLANQRSIDVGQASAIHAAGRVPTWVIPVDEARQMLDDVLPLLSY